MKQQQELIPRTPGEFLKQQRKTRRLSLSAVAKALSLDENLLMDIEDGKPLRIADVYRTGYIRAYAQHLQIPVDEIPGLKLSEAVRQPRLRTVFKHPRKRNPHDQWLRATSYVLASLLVGTLAWQFTHEAVRLSQSGPQLDTGQDKSATEQRLEHELRPKQPVNASIASLAVLHSDSAAGLDAAEQAWNAVSQPVLPEGESRLQVSVSADCWVEITDSDGSELEMDLLRGGTEKAYQGKPPFRILFGHAPAVSLLIDGERVDLTPFTRDNVAQVNWPQQEVSALK